MGGAVYTWQNVSGSSNWNISFSFMLVKFWVRIRTRMNVWVVFFFCVCVYTNMVFVLYCWKMEWSVCVLYVCMCVSIRIQTNVYLNEHFGHKWNVHNYRPYPKRLARCWIGSFYYVPAPVQKWRNKTDMTPASANRLHLGSNLGNLCTLHSIFNFFFFFCQTSPLIMTKPLFQRQVFEKCFLYIYI